MSPTWLYKHGYNVKPSQQRWSHNGGKKKPKTFRPICQAKEERQHFCADVTLPTLKLWSFRNTSKFILPTNPASPAIFPRKYLVYTSYRRPVIRASALDFLSLLGLARSGAGDLQATTGLHIHHILPQWRHRTYDGDRDTSLMLTATTW